MVEPEKSYEDGIRDAWIEAIKANCKVSMGAVNQRLQHIDDTLTALSAKVNHIYGGAAVFGAISGAFTSAVILLLKK